LKPTRTGTQEAFNGGRITSDGGVALLALADRRIGIIDRIAGLIADSELIASGVPI
jgi:hypothetical protein